MQKHNDAMKTSGHSSLEKYTSHFIERVVWEGVGDRTELQHIDPYSYGHNSVSFLFSWPAQPGAWGPSLSGTWSSFQHLFSNSSELQLLNRGSWGSPLLGAGSPYNIFLQLNRTSNAPSYIIVLRPLNSTFRQWRLSPWHIRPDAPVIYTGAFPARPGSICNNTIWFDLAFWLINYCRLFNARSSLYIYFKYIWFGFVLFYGLSTIVGYIMVKRL